MPWHAGSHNYIHVNFSCLVCLSMHALTDYQYTPKQDIRLHRVEGCLHVQTYTINSLILTTRHNTKDLAILFFIDTEICAIILLCMVITRFNSILSLTYPWPSINLCEYNFDHATEQWNPSIRTPLKLLIWIPCMSPAT